MEANFVTQLPSRLSVRPQPDAHKLTHHDPRRHRRRRGHNLVRRCPATDLQLGLPCPQQHNIPRPGLDKTLPARLRHRLQRHGRHRPRRGLHGEHGRLHEQLRLLRPVHRLFVGLPARGRGRQTPLLHEEGPEAVPRGGERLVFCHLAEIGGRVDVPFFF